MANAQIIIASPAVLRKGPESAKFGPVPLGRVWADFLGSLSFCGVKPVVAVLAVLRVVDLMSENLIKRFNLNDLLP